MNDRMTAVGALKYAAVLALAGCATGKAAREEPSPFPTRQQMAAVEQSQTPTTLFARAGLDVDRWALAGPLPTAAALVSHTDETRWGKLLSDVIATRSGLVYAGESMHCVAREVGRFFLENGQMPSTPVQEFVAARCGAVEGPVQFGWLSQKKLPADVDETAIFDHFDGDLRKMVGQQVASGTLAAGLWYGRQNEKAVVMVTTMRRLSRIDSVPLLPGDSGKVTVRGEVLIPAATLRALVSQGRYGYAECRVDTTTHLPQFAVECPTLANDAWAWVEVSVFPVGRIIGPRVVNLLVWPSGKIQDAYARAESAAAESAQGASAAEAILDHINAARRAVQLSEMALAPRQSETATRVAPHYFAALEGNEIGIEADTVALGLMAGWDVDGTVHEGHFASAIVYRAGDPGQLVASVLSHPSGRSTLMNPRASQLAIGIAESPEHNARAAVFASYSLFEQDDHGKSEQAILRQLRSARAQQATSAPVLVPELSRLAREVAESVGKGRLTPDKGMQLLADRVAEEKGQATHVWVVQTSSLDLMKFPPALTESKTLRVGIGAASYRPQGQPWGRYVVYLVMYNLTEI